MKKLSLKWRLTLITAALVAAACLILSFFVSNSAVTRMKEIETYRIEIEPNGQDPMAMCLADLYPDLREQIRQARTTFLMQSVLITLAVIVCGSALTYFLAGQMLAPLGKFNERIKKVQAQNLSEPMPLPEAEDEIAGLTLSFNGMLERLNHAFAMHRQFSANAAHELRTPLTVIQTRLELLKRQGTPSASEYAGILLMVSEQTERLSHVVEELLELTETETVRRDEEVSLSALAEEVLCDLAKVAEEKQVRLIQIPGEAGLTGSDLLLYRAVYNLVENAVKYNRPGGTVTVASGMKDGRAWLRVADTGIGIGREHWESIFEPFVRVDKSRSRSMGGAGLGLALVKRIAKQHGGTVRVAESSDAGTVMELLLPAGA